MIANRPILEDDLAEGLVSLAPAPARHASPLTPGEESQLAQTIEMFEVITQSQPLDYQSLEILKEAYSKLGREKDVINTSKKIAQAYVQLGQLSSAILEYETILQRHPNDPDVQAALSQIESKATSFPLHPPSVNDTPPPLKLVSTPTTPSKAAEKIVPKEVDDGRRTMHRIFVESKVITEGDFDLCWRTPDLAAPPQGVVEPFVQVLADKGILPVEKSLIILADKSRAAYLPLHSYDVDIDLTRSFPAAICQRWCILPFDRMGKSILVATVNPFNQQAAKELAEATASRLLWYLATPSELISNLRKAFR